MAAVALFGTFGWGTFAAAIAPSVALGLNWKRASGAACVASIAVSLVLNFALELLNRHNLYTLPYGMNVGCFSLLVSLIAFVMISLLSRDSTGTQIAPDVRAAMEV
jgi:Na+/proline symporter